MASASQRYEGSGQSRFTAPTDTLAKQAANLNANTATAADAISEINERQKKSIGSLIGHLLKRTTLAASIAGGIVVSDYITDPEKSVDQIPDDASTWFEQNTTVQNLRDTLDKYASGAVETISDKVDTALGVESSPAPQTLNNENNSTPTWMKESLEKDWKNLDKTGFDPQDTKPPSVDWEAAQNEIDKQAQEKGIIFEPSELDINQ